MSNNNFIKKKGKIIGIIKNHNTNYNKDNNNTKKQEILKIKLDCAKACQTCKNKCLGSNNNGCIQVDKKDIKYFQIKKINQNKKSSNNNNLKKDDSITIQIPKTKYYSSLFKIFILPIIFVITTYIITSFLFSANKIPIIASILSLLGYHFLLKRLRN